jgi:hypothetical protein
MSKRGTLIVNMTNYSNFDLIGDENGRKFTIRFLKSYHVKQ